MKVLTFEDTGISTCDGSGKGIGYGPYGPTTKWELHFFKKKNVHLFDRISLYDEAA